MDNAVYTALNRQAGLMIEMRTVANNIANMSTTGFRREGVVFAEHVDALGGDEPSLSMADAAGRLISPLQGVLTQTGSPYDLAIEGDGFFRVQAPDGERLTRAGAFTPSAEGDLMTADGFRLLDAGGAPITVPLDRGAIAVGRDGTISVGGQPVAQVGLVLPADPLALRLAGGTTFHADGDLAPVDNVNIFQGFLENSNVNPVEEIARMIQVQRAYEMGQSFLDKEDARIRSVVETLGR